MPGFYRRKRGAVVSAAIDKFVVVTAAWRRDGRISVGDGSLYASWHDIGDPILRSVFQSLDWRGGVDVSIASDVTSNGSGLGASSAVAVGLMNALGRLSGHDLGPHELAARAAHAEMTLASRDIGKQDAYPPAFGGLRHYRFLPDEMVDCRSVDLAPEKRAELSSWLMLFDTGHRRDASKMLATQKVLIPTTIRDEALSRMVQLAEDLASDLGRSDLSRIGDYFDEAWYLKASLGALDGKPELAEIHDRAKSLGAFGVKILGAGGGGHFLFLAPPDAHARIRLAFEGGAVQKVAIHQQGSYVDDVGQLDVRAS